MVGLVGTVCACALLDTEGQIVRPKYHVSLSGTSRCVLAVEGTLAFDNEVTLISFFM